MPKNTEGNKFIYINIHRKKIIFENKDVIKYKKNISQPMIADGYATHETWKFCERYESHSQLPFLTWVTVIVINLEQNSSARGA